MINLFYLILVILIGLVIGSFLNCFIWRLHEDESVGGRSYCPKCRHQIAWYDNIPVLSFIFLKAKCRHCHQPISWQYPLVEIATAILFVLLFFKNISSASFALLMMRDWLLVSALIVIFVYDLRWQLVPMGVVWSMCALMLVFNILLGYSWVLIIISALVATAFFWIQYILTKKKGLGEGDIWLGLLLGLSFPNFSHLLAILIISYGVGSLVSLILLLVKKKHRKSRIALGPFLAFGAIITLIWGDQLINWYLGLFS